MTPSGSPCSRNTLSVAAVTVDTSASITSARPTRKPASLGQSAGDASSIALSVASYGLLIGGALSCGPRLDPPHSHHNYTAKHPSLLHQLVRAKKLRRPPVMVQQP